MAHCRDKLDQHAMVTINDQIESIAKSVCKQSFHWMANPKALTKLAPDFSKAQMINGELVEVQINDVGVALADVFDDADREAGESHGPGWTTSGGEDEEAELFRCLEAGELPPAGAAVDVACTLLRALPVYRARQPPSAKRNYPRFDRARCAHTP